MTSSNKVRRYLQQHKNHQTSSVVIDPQNNHQSAAELLVIDPTISVTSMRKFRARTQQPLIPQICVNEENSTTTTTTSNKNDENDAIAILDEFEQVLENELKRTSSLKHRESPPINQQQRSFSFALGSTTMTNDDENLKEMSLNDLNDELIDSLALKPTKSPSTIKASLSKETFSRLLHSFAFRSNKMTSNDSPCLACQSQNLPNLDFLPKSKKRPSIFGVLVSKLNNNGMNSDPPSQRCSVCKRRLNKSIFYPSQTADDQYTSSLSSKCPTTKRRRSLPSLFHSLFDIDNEEKPQQTFIENFQSEQTNVDISNGAVALVNSHSSSLSIDDFDRDPTTNEKVRRKINRSRLRRAHHHHH